MKIIHVPECGVCPFTVIPTHSSVLYWCSLTKRTIEKWELPQPAWCQLEEEK
jgi:hypothetical protein